jgi:pimeloyl-ACP methyl ester carboxylesterase
MFRLTRFLAAIALAVGLATTARAAQNAPAAPKPTIVLVHGAFAESASWNGVITLLTRGGYRVVALANPLRSVSGDAAYVAAALGQIEGPVVLVGHSYGGTVISAAALGRANVRALVYVAGFIPEAGETSLGLSGQFPGSTLGGALAPPVALPGGGQDLYIRQDRFRAQFAADVPATEAVQMAATQRPVAQAALVEPSGEPAWRTIPFWSVWGSADLNIPAAAHAFMAARAHARHVLEIQGASHVVMISHPREVAAVIEAATATR